MKFFSNHIHHFFLLPGGIFLFLVLVLSTAAKAQTPPEGAAKVIVIGDHDDSLIIVPTGEKQSLDFSATVNHDPAVSQECTLDGPTWTWASSVETLTATDQSANLSYEFDSAGTYTISVSATATYKTTWHTENGNVAGDDIVVTSDPKTYNVKAIKKIWSVGPGIGVAWDSGTKQQAKDQAGNLVFDGRLTLPQDQTVTPAAPQRVVVTPGTVVPCSVEDATDIDKAWMDLNGDGVEQDDEISYEPDDVNYAWSCPSGTFSSSNQATTSWTAPQEGGRYTLTCIIDDAPKAIGAGQEGSRDDQAHPIQIEVTVATISVSFDKDTVAAGSITSPAHQSELKVQIMAGNEGVAGILVGKPIIVEGGRAKKDGISAHVDMANEITGADGIAKGVFTSGNRGEVTIVQIPPSADALVAGLEADITQGWNEVDSPWTYDPYFDYGQSSTVIYKMAVKNSDTWLPIDGHTLEFKNIAFTGQKWNPQGGVDLDGDGIVDGAYDDFDGNEQSTPIQEWAAWNALSTWSNVAETPPGSYKSDEIITLDSSRKVESVSFEVEEHTAFDDQGDDSND